MTPQELTEAQERLSALRTLRANGVRTIRSGDDEVTYKSDAEMATAIADLERRVASAGDKPTVTFVNFRSQKGWA